MKQWHWLGFLLIGVSLGGQSIKIQFRYWDNTLSTYLPLKAGMVQYQKQRYPLDDRGMVLIQRKLPTDSAKLYWKTEHLTIRKNHHAPAFYDFGWQSKDSILKIDFTKDDLMQYYSIILSAAHYYLTESRTDLSKPKFGYPYGKTINICAIDTYNAKKRARNIHIQNMIPAKPLGTIYIRMRNLPSHKIVGSTIHEMAHSAHFSHVNPLHFVWGNDLLIETYAETIEWYFTNRFYKEWGHYFGINGYLNGMQNLTAKKQKNYTSLLIDMMDDFNQKNLSGIDDALSGWDLKILEQWIFRYPAFKKFKTMVLKHTNEAHQRATQNLLSNWR